jgi:hypothetical protein
MAEDKNAHLFAQSPDSMNRDRIEKSRNQSVLPEEGRSFYIKIKEEVVSL